MQVRHLNILRLGGSGLGTIGLLVLMSFQLGPLPPLGTLIDPNYGLWAVSDKTELPEYETITGLDLQGDEVTVFRDEWGIPHIYAENEYDLSYAVGWVHAQDRLWQLDIQKRMFSGTLSEVAGEAALETDIFFRTIGLFRAAKASLEALEADSTTHAPFINALEAYANGINDYIDRMDQEDLPLEFRLLNYQPTHWRPVDSLAFGKLMAYSLALDMEIDLQMGLVYNAFQEKFGVGQGSILVEELFPINSTYNVVPVLPDYGNYSYSLSNPSSRMTSAKSSSSSSTANYAVPNAVKETLKDILGFQSSMREDLRGTGLLGWLADFRSNFLGSNNWVVDGNKSATGYPIMANDMHLAHNLPPIWYECHQVILGTDFNVYGFTFIGIPAAVAGHNRYCSWGFTNVGADVTDYYYYRESTDGTSYWNATSGTWQEYEIITEEIKVKEVLGTSTKTIHIKKTGDGPIITPEVHEEDYTVPVAMKWAGSGPTFEMKTVYLFNRMKNLTDFIEAQRDTWFCPGQNTIFADVWGNIAIRPVAHYPIRAPGDWGRVPVNGSAGEGRWLGYIPYDDLPVSANPPQGYLASANQKTAGPDYPYFMGSFFDMPYRGQRINEILANAPDGSVTVDFMKKAQADNVDNSAKSFVPIILAIDPTKAGDQQSKVQAVQTLLQAWNYTMLREWVEPTIYHFWLDIFQENTFNDEWTLVGLESDNGNYPQLHVLEELVTKNATVRWFDDNSTTQVETIEDIALQSLLDAFEEMEEQFETSNIEKWIWGEYNLLHVDHLAGIDALSANSDGYSWDGSDRTLNAAFGGERDDYAVKHGPSERFVVDLNPSVANDTHAWSCLPGGQRGWALSKHYKDQLEELWLQYKYHDSLFYGTAEAFPAAQIESTLILKS
ncbi:MAG: penicillin acylase family protein [Candidatus Hodarchaeales archaeon]